MNATIEQRISDASDEFTVRLDDLQRALPSIPAKALEVTRAGVRRVNDVVASAACSVSSRVGTVGDTVETSARTAAGQTRAQVARVAKTATTGAATAAGQARSSVRRSADVAAEQIDAGLDDAKLAVDPDDLSTMTKAELYDRAQALDIDGRSGMSKAELVSALQKA